MCGITGIWDWTRAPERLAALESFTRALAHRGPDGEGFFRDAARGLGLGHRRLAILDLSPQGRQPLAYADGRYQVVHNGEIYNFIELRRELEAAGCAFRSQTDTEVIAAAYAHWGPDCQLKFNGMWAFAIWDAREETLFLSRDRFGIKPLYFLDGQGFFAFASEMKAFGRLPGFSGRPNRHALRGALTNPFAAESGEECLWEGLRRLRAGHCLLVRAAQLKAWRWWRTLDHLTPTPARLEEQAERFRELFLDACRLRLRSDVPVGTCLSGGLDSSAVLCALAEVNARAPQAAAERRTPHWQRAFVASFPGTPLDERPYAEAAIRHSGAEPRILALDAATLAGDLERLIYDFEDITATLPWPMWALYRELRREGVVVSLDGHGGDETLAGYAHHLPRVLQGTLGLLLTPGRACDILRTMRGFTSQDGGGERPSWARLLARNAGALVVPPRLFRFSWRRRVRSCLKHATARRLFPFLREPLVAEPLLDPADAALLDNLGPLTAQLYVDCHLTILPAILRNFDRCSMAHGVEVRMPFLDWRLVTYVFSLPDESKIGGGFTKRVLREAMRGRMPEEIRTRRSKVGFNSPLPNWFGGVLKEWLRERVHERDFAQSEVWDGPAVRDFVEQRAHSGGWTWPEAQQVWLILHAYLWGRAFVKRQP